MSMIVDGNNFEKVVIESEVPVVVDFFATWCGPCKMISPSIEEISESMQGKAKVVKVDIDESSEIASKYGIMGVPTLLYFKEGKIADQLVGAAPKDVILGKLEGLL